MEQSFTFHLPNDLAEVPRARERFEEDLTSALIAGDELEAWKLVFTELLCNAIEHGCEGPGQSVQIHYSVTRELVDLTISDPGDCEPNLESLFDRTETDFSETGRGAGLILIRHFTDEISVRPGEAGGTIVYVKRLRRGPDAFAGAGGLEGSS